MAEQTLTSAIESAVEKEQPKSSEVATPEAKVDSKVDEAKLEAKEEEIEVEEDKSLGLDAVEQEQAKQLFAALKDPAKAPVVLRFLAEQAGYIKTEAKAEEAKSEILSVLEENLGPEFSIISSRLEKALDKIIDSKLTKSQADIRAKMHETEEAKLVTESEGVMTSLAKSYFDADEIPKDIVSEMDKQMDRMPPSSDMSVKEYIETVFAAVAFKRGITAKTATNKERANKNRNDAPGRLASERSASPKLGQELPKSTSLKDAVQAAVEQINQEMS